jgi:hypothetical protein
MKPGIYTVQSWNNKDAVLIGDDDGEFLTLTKAELPKIFEGWMFVGEKIEVIQTVTIQPVGSKNLDERARATREKEIADQKRSQAQKDFIAAENERRMRYGVKPIC